MQAAVAENSTTSRREDFIRGIGNPPGWLASDEINRMRGEMPIPYVLVVPVRTDDLGRVSQVGSLLRVSDDGSIERTLIAGRVLYHESLREAVGAQYRQGFGRYCAAAVAGEPTAVHRG